MPPLHEFVGSREAGKQLLETFKYHPGQSEEKAERIQAILQNLAFSNNLQSNSLGVSQVESHPQRQDDRNQQRAVLPSFRNDQCSSRPLQTNIRWQVDHFHPDIKETTKKSRVLAPALHGPNTIQNIFGTDIENFDDTNTTSDFSDCRLKADELNPDSDVVVGLNRENIFRIDQGTKLDLENDHNRKNSDDLHLKNPYEHTLNELANGFEGSEPQSEIKESQPDVLLAHELVSRRFPLELNDFQDGQNLSGASNVDLSEISPSVAVIPPILENLTLRGSLSISNFIIYPQLGETQTETKCLTEPIAHKDDLEQCQLDHESQESLHYRDEREFRMINGIPSTTWIHQKRDKHIRNHHSSQDLHDQSRSSLSIYRPLVSRYSQANQMMPPKISTQDHKYPSVSSTALATSNTIDGKSANGVTTDSCINRDISVAILKRPVNLDYSFKQLSQMAYKDLTLEDFDFVPHARTANSVQNLRNSELSERLQAIFEMKSGTDLPWRREAEFSSMSIEQHGECGELIMEEFNNVIARYSAARLQKRTVAMVFEDEVASREKSIQAKMMAIDVDMDRLRNAGEDVVRGKWS